MIETSFGRGQWDPSDWWMVKGPRWDHTNEWIQESDHIRTDGPETVAGQTYTSMVWRHSIEGDVEIRSTMSFDERMAPLLVLGPEPAAIEGGIREYREHLELVLFDEGINLWHHTWANGEPAWTLPANWRFPVEARRKYALGLARRGDRLLVSLDDAPVGEHTLALPGPQYAGITGCEGTNRFYDFSLA